MSNTKLNPSAVSDINFRLDCTVEVLRAIWDAIDCGGSTSEEFVGCLGHIVNALFELSNELTALTEQPDQKAQGEQPTTASIESAFPGLSPDVAIALIKAGLEATGKAVAE